MKSSKYNLICSDIDYKNKFCANNQKSINEYKILRKTNLTNIEIDLIYKIIKDNMLLLGFYVSNEDKKIWISNFLNNLQNQNFYCYIIYDNEQIIGFIEAVKANNKLTLSEIEFDSNHKKTRLILNVIYFLAITKDFAEFDELYFNINKKNINSTKTFSHLGCEIVEERRNCFLYKLKRANVDDYLKKFKIYR